MARRIGHNEFAFGSGKGTVGHVNGNTLLALGGEAVNQQSKIEVAALRAQLF